MAGGREARWLDGWGVRARGAGRAGERALGGVWVHGPAQPGPDSRGCALYAAAGAGDHRRGAAALDDFRSSQGLQCVIWPAGHKPVSDSRPSAVDETQNKERNLAVKIVRQPKKIALI